MGESVVEIRRKQHAQLLRQAYGFYPDVKAGDSISFPVGVTDFDDDGWSTLHHAASSNDIGVLRDILWQIDFSHIESTTDSVLCGVEFTPLLCCCRGNAINTFDELIAHGADIHVTDNFGRGVIEVCIASRSVDLFEHLLKSGYMFGDLKIWDVFISLMLANDSDNSHEVLSLRIASFGMVEALILRSSKYMHDFLGQGGYSVLTDTLKSFTVLPRTPKSSPKLNKILSEDSDYDGDRAVLISVLIIVNVTLANINNREWQTLFYNYSDLISSLVTILSKGNEVLRIEVQKSLMTISRNKTWGVKLLIENDVLPLLLRSLLLDNEDSYTYPIVEAMHETDPTTLINSFTVSEMEILISLLQCEKRIKVQVFVLRIFSIIILQNIKVKRFIFQPDVISSIIAALGTKDSVQKLESFTLLKHITGDPEGLQAFFSALVTFQKLISCMNREVSESFDSCSILLWQLIVSCASTQDSVRVVENIGVGNIIRMLESRNTDVVCVGAECIKILAKSVKYDHCLGLCLKNAPVVLLDCIKSSTRGDALFSSLTAVSELALAWSIYYPNPQVQNLLVQKGGLSRALQILQTGKYHSVVLQSAALKVVAACLLGNVSAEKRINDLGINFTQLIPEQQSRTRLSDKLLAESVALFKLNDILKGQHNYKSLTLPGLSTDFLHIIQQLYGRSEVDERRISDLVRADCDTSWRQLASLAQFKPCAVLIGKHLDKVVQVLYHSNFRMKQSSALILSLLSCHDDCHENLLIEVEEDVGLFNQIAKLGCIVPISEGFLDKYTQSSTREHRRRQLKKHEGTNLPPLSRHATIASDSNQPLPPLQREYIQLPVLARSSAATIEKICSKHMPYKRTQIASDDTSVTRSRPKTFARDLSVVN